MHLTKKAMCIIRTLQIAPTLQTLKLFAFSKLKIFSDYILSNI